MSAVHTRFMRMALGLGRRGMGRTWPNPAVGCVIVQNGRIVGRGWTADGGRPHAETRALHQAGATARGATVYVTLEPCAHHGQTPPCAQALIDARVGHVVATLPDSDPRVSGRGFAMLREAGIAVTTGVLANEAAEDHAGFFLRVGKSRPFVTLKLASSFDGRIATSRGHSQWITGPEARRKVHAMRALHDAVMVGAGTARADDPSLTVRGIGVSRQPVRVVVSRRLDVPLTGELARSAHQAPVWLCHGAGTDPDRRRAWAHTGARLIQCSETDGQLDAKDVLARLAGEGLTRVFCEGGGALAASLLRADAVDRMVGFTAGFAIGSEGLAGIGALGLSRLDDARRYTLSDVQACGADVLHVWSRSAG